MWGAVMVVALPLVALLAGLASLYIDPQREPNKKWVLVALLFLSAAGSVAGSISDSNEKDSDRTIMVNQSTQLAAVKNDTTGILTGVGQLTAMLRAAGVSPAVTDTIQRSVDASAARAAILPVIQKSPATSNVTIAYYPKDVDGPVVINALKEGGFQVREGKGNPRNANLGTNAVWIGTGVSVEQARFVTLTLVRAGVGIVSIRRGFSVNSAANKNLIEVGTDGTLTGNTPLTVDQINGIADIPLQNPGTKSLAD